MPPVDPSSRASPCSGSRVTVLVLGGTSEARALAGALAALPAPGFTVISSLAGRTRDPLLPPGEVRIGGFGGVDGLVAFLRERGIDVLVDATHPFADRISANAAAAATAARVPLIVLRRGGWLEQPGDDWRRVGTLAEAAELLPRLGERVFLTTGRQGISAFAGLDECWFLARSVEPPTPPMPPRLEVLLDRGPFHVDGELRLLREHRIDVLVTKDSGGPAAKLEAARKAGTPVVMINRPAPPPAAITVGTPEEALRRILDQSHNCTE